MRRADHSSRGVLENVVRLSVIQESHRGGLSPLGMPSHVRKNICTTCLPNMQNYLLFLEFSFMIFIYRNTEPEGRNKGGSEGSTDGRTL